MQDSFQRTASLRPVVVDGESPVKPRHNTFAANANASVSSNPSANLADSDNAPAVRLLTDTLLEATRRNASDLHVEPAEHGWRVRLRIDGVLHEIPQPPAHLRDAFITRVKVLARMDIAERRVPQDGRLRIATSPGRVEDYRVNSLPTLFGEKLVPSFSTSLFTFLSFYFLLSPSLFLAQLFSFYLLNAFAADPVSALTSTRVSPIRQRACRTPPTDTLQEHPPQARLTSTGDCCAWFAHRRRTHEIPQPPRICATRSSRA